MRICSLGILVALFQLVPHSQALDSLNADEKYWPKDDNTLCTTDSKTGIRTCYPRIFNATNEFQLIMPGQEIPRGLHVQLDMGTGQRQARLMAADDSVDEQALAITPAGSNVIERMRICSLGILVALFQLVPHSQALDSLNADEKYWPKDDNTLCTTDSKTGIRTCYPRIFNATNKFQLIMPGQEIPRGLHVQLDMGTGQRQARLMAADDSVDEQALAITPVGSNVIERVDSDYRSQQEMLENNLLDTSNTHKLMGFVINAGNGLVDHTMRAQLDRELEDLKELAYDTQKAERLIHEPGAVSALLRLSDPTHKPLPWPAYTRQLSSIVLGTLVQNNPALQGIAYRSGAIYSLIHILKHEYDARTASKHIFALSALIRGYAPALEQFVDLDGFHLMHDIDSHTSTAYSGGEVECARLDLRVVRLFEDLLNPEFNPNVNQNTKFQIVQFAAFWCNTLARRLINNTDEISEGHGGFITYERRVPYLDSLQMLKLTHRDTCKLPDGFEAWAQAELSRISDNKDEGNEDYRQALIDLDAQALTVNN
ncbi:hypothetical protein COEREDRAFT_86516 [Coemansia reversa NRRL 1564]|uniref:Nucleotide exchange factor SIL1 n=1 Tax=Coemansia reversa (strain ATCC 12441 / NRRL 1564) TaxID=763665 RepID=A0A2G5BDM7_COERN|nr:hypothetical protein COEREDRAFT_86516 [Coemansia reversa NRRL 1564]|eukprot:PIA17119.1 hypothetical protein COEREDRAFT_86516 [Coemansia reversa NRRL 1564]